MIDTTIQVVDSNGQNVTVPAQIDPHWPGLAIHPTMRPLSEWDITHTHSGLKICSLFSAAKARAALPRIGKLMDWNRAADKLFLQFDHSTQLYVLDLDLDRLHAVKQKVAAIVKDVNGRQRTLAMRPRRKP